MSIISVALGLIT